MARDLHLGEVAIIKDSGEHPLSSELTSGVGLL